MRNSLMKKLKLKIKRRIEFQAATRGQAHIKQSKKTNREPTSCSRNPTNQKRRF
jgi:hypothetical protein